MNMEKMKEIEGYLRSIEGVLAKQTESQSDDYACGLWLCDSIRAAIIQESNDMDIPVMIASNIEYRGLCKNRKSGEYDALFVTEFSELLCQNRTKSKANLHPEQYDADDIVIQTRTVKSYASEWR